MKWTIGNKIGGLIVFSGLMFLILGIFAYSMIVKLNESIAWNDHTYLVLQNEEMVISLLKDAETGQRGFILTGDDQYLEPYNEATKSIYKYIDTGIKLTKDNPLQQERIKKVKLLVDDKLEVLNQTINLRKNNGFDAALKVVLTNKGKTLMDQIRLVVDEIENTERGLLEIRNSSMHTNVLLTKSVIIYGSLLSLIFIVLIGVLIVRNISRPLNEITKIATRISEGDLNVELMVAERSDEVGILLQNFKKMIDALKGMAAAAQKIAAGDLTGSITPQSESDLLGNAFLQMLNNLRSIMKDISESVNLLASSSSEILVATTQIATGSSETASAITETTTTVEEVRQAAQLSSQKASRVSENAQQVVQVTQIGQKAVDETLRGMEEIQNQMDSVANTIVRLSEQSQQIGGIIASVTDVADQSNLLAVNAAIEAAKAGEQGKGFAVVAQEIKNLAQQSKQATVQVRNILTDIQKATSSAVMATEQTSKAVENGVKQSAQAGDAIKKLAESSTKAVEAATQIVASSQQQTVGMDQIGLAMQNINQAGTENAASMIQAEKAAKGLNELGQKLKALVEQYKI